ncbi:vacuolar-processing enzyme alpha-isozyme [Aphelenchoides avenae]|nr:vacuolar-processing enzyme alpha-isozyme [Aphelenchus avenae]
MDACFSGSIFDTVPADLNSTISRAEGANVMYCPWDCDAGTDDPQQCAVIEDVGTCLSALFSGLWLDDIVRHDLDETLHDQFESLKKAVPASKDDSDDQKVSHWGDLSIAKERISEFQGRVNATKQTSLTRFKPLGATSIDEVPLRMHAYRVRKQALAEGLSDDQVNERVGQVSERFLAESSTVHKFFTAFIKQVLGTEESASELVSAALPLTA